jgi:hypothetical protein
VTGLRTRLQELDLHELRSIVRTHRLDPTRLSDKWKTQERLIDLIVDRVEARAKQGETFRQYAPRMDRSETIQTNAETTSSSNEAKDIHRVGARTTGNTPGPPASEEVAPARSEDPKEP